MATPRHHLFVCQNWRPEGGKPSCGGRKSGDVLAALQRALGADRELCGLVAVTDCGCLGPCFDGPMVVVYPDGVWYQRVVPDDAQEIVERHLRGGEPVERLRFRFED